MRLIIGIIVFVFFAIPLCIFAVENRQILALKFAPLAAKFELPAAIWLLAFLGIGMITGLAIGFFSGLTWRHRARKAERLNRVFERKLDNNVEPASVVPPRQALTTRMSPRGIGQKHSVLIDD